MKLLSSDAGLSIILMVLSAIVPCRYGSILAPGRWV